MLLAMRTTRFYPSGCSLFDSIRNNRWQGRMRDFFRRNVEVLECRSLSGTWLVNSIEGFNPAPKDCFTSYFHLRITNGPDVYFGRDTRFWIFPKNSWPSWGKYSTHRELFRAVLTREKFLKFLTIRFSQRTRDASSVFLKFFKNLKFLVGQDFMTVGVQFEESRALNTSENRHGEERWANFK